MGLALVEGGWVAEPILLPLSKVLAQPRHTTAKKKKPVKREFLSLRVVTRKTDDTIMMYKNLAIDLCIFEWNKQVEFFDWVLGSGGMFCAAEIALFYSLNPPSS